MYGTTYRYPKMVSFFILLLFVISCYGIISFFYAGKTVQFLLAAYAAPVLLYFSIIEYFVITEIDEKKIKVSSKNFIRQRQLDWSDIEAIIDDSPFPRLQFTHIYHLMPKRVFSEKPKKRIIITTYFRNYRDLLKEIVQRVSPGTKVDPSILKLTNLTQEDIGKLYKQAQ